MECVEHFCRENRKHPFKGQLDPASGRQDDQTERDDLEKGDDEKGFYRSGACDVRLFQMNLRNPAGEVECVRQADESIDDGKVQRLRGVGGKAPRQQHQHENRNTIGRQRNGVIAKPSVAERDVAVLVVHFETVDFPKEKEGEQKMGELVREFHQPLQVAAHSGDQEQRQEREKSDGQPSVQRKPAGRNFQRPSLRQDSHGQCVQYDKKDANQHVARHLQALA